MYFAASLFLAFAITLLFVSHIAKMLLAKRPGIGWIFLSSLVGGILAGIALIPIKIYVVDVEPMVMMIISLVVVLIVSSAAFKYINQMSWGGAITTNISNVVISLVTVVVAVFINGESIQDTVSMVTSTAKNNTVIVESVATGELDVSEVLDAQNNINSDADTIQDQDVQEEDDLVITELDLLPPSAVKEIEAKKNKVFREPKFRVISLGDINTAVGRKIRILKSNGRTILGSLKSVNGNSITISRRLTATSGEAVTPIALAKIQKLEVYR